VPESAQHLDAQWLSSALVGAGTLPAGTSVTNLTVGEIVIEVDGGEDILNGGGVAGAKTLRVKDIEYAGAEYLENKKNVRVPGSAPSTLIEKWASTADTVPPTLARQPKEESLDTTQRMRMNLSSK
jgi:hypothetical protein